MTDLEPADVQLMCHFCDELTALEDMTAENKCRWCSDE